MNKMKLITGEGLRNTAGCYLQALKSVLLHLWEVYSAPAPAGRDILTLLSLCVTLAFITGGLLYHWLCKTLEYSSEVSILMACVYSVVMSLVSILFHPLRCVLTMILPTICTKQGRKLLLSASVMILVLNVVPNITINVRVVLRLLKCTSESFARTLLNSSDPLNHAKRDLIEESIKMQGDNLNIYTRLKKFDHITHVDVSEVNSRFMKLIGQTEHTVSHATDLLKEYKLLSNRILAAILVILLILQSSRYLKSYLTSLQFDNSHIPKELLQNVTHAGNERTAKNNICPLRCQITSQECTSSVLALVVVTLYFIAISLIVALDYVVYYIVQLILPLFLNFPSMTAGLSVDYRVRLFVLYQHTQDYSNFHRDYKWTFNLDPSLCDVATSAPNQGVMFLLGCLWLMSYCLVFLELFARRLRRKISASFFKEQEEKRKDYLMNKIQAKLNKKQQEGAVSVVVGRE